MKKKYYKEYHRLFEGIIVEACEGEGIEESPKRLVFYVYDKELNKVGKIDTLWEQQQIQKSKERNL